MSGELIGCDDCHGTIEIAGVPGSDPAGRWCMYDLSPLLSDEAVRGSDRLMPGAEGRRPKRRRYDVTKRLLPVVFTGFVDDTGMPVGRDDAPAQLELTLLGFQQSLNVGPFRVPQTGDGTLAVEWTLNSGATLATDVHVVNLRERRTGWGIWDGDVELSMPLPWALT